MLTGFPKDRCFSGTFNRERISIINAESYSSCLLAFPRVPQISSGTLTRPLLLPAVLLFPSSSRRTYRIINMRSASTHDVIRIASLRHQLCILDICQSRCPPPSSSRAEIRPRFASKSKESVAAESHSHAPAPFLSSLMGNQGGGALGRERFMENVEVQ